MSAIGPSLVSECKGTPTRLRFAKLSFDVWTMRMKMFARKLRLA
jgi:hypothetical protein